MCIFCQPAILQAQDGALQKIRNEVKSGTADSPSSDGKKSSGDGDSDSCNCLGDLLGLALLAPFYVPHCLLEDEFDHDGYFPRYPYADGGPGYMRIRRVADEDSDPEPQPDFQRMRGWSGRVAVEESNDFDSINRAALRLLLETGSRFGVQTNWSYVHESLGCGCSDETVLGDVNLTFRFAQHENAQMRAGVGARMISDRHATDFGFNFTYGADIYPCKPFVMSAVLDAGTLGKVGVFRAHGSIGVLYKRWEIYTGYDYLRIGSTSLQGPILGLRLWF
jgi:hypothetical protein